MAYTETAHWLFEETGLSRLQYTNSAITQIVTSCVSVLRKQKQSSGDHSQSQCGSTITAISELCVPIISYEEALPLVECLLEVAFHAAHLSPLFLEAATKGLRVCADAESRVSLSYRAKLALWTLYLPSYRLQLLDMMEDYSSFKGSCGKDTIDVMLAKYHIPEACLDRPQLSMYTKEFILSFLNSGSVCVTLSELEFLVGVLNTSMMDLYMSKTIKPLVCPQFTVQ